MIEKRNKFIALFVFILILIVVLFFYNLLKQRDVEQNNFSDIDAESLQTQIEEPPQRVQEHNSSNNTDNIHNNVDMNDINFLTDDIIESVDWDWYQSQLRDPKQVVKVRATLLDLYKLAQAFDQNDLPAFYEVLNDDNSTGYERQLAINFIGQISDKGNSEAAQVLIDYVQKEVNWEKRQNDADDHEAYVMDAYEIILSKRDTLDWLGYVGGNDKDIEEFLKKAMTTDGAREIVNQWYEGAPESASSEEAVLENLRGFAARGLAYINDPAVHELIRSEYEREKQACIVAGKQYGDYYFNQLCEAVTRIDIIKDIGLDAHKALYDSEGSHSYTYRTYIRKYLLFETKEPVMKKSY